MKFASWAAVRLGLAAFLVLSTVMSRAAEKQLQAKEILERYAKAIGGQEAFRKHKSQHATGTVSMPAQNMNGKMEVFAARPNKLLIKMSLPGIGDLNTAYNGSAGWIYSQITGAMMLEGKMVEQMAAQAEFDQALHNPADYQSMELLGAEEFSGEDCYKVKLVHKTGFESTEYFSKKTGLQKGFTATQDSPLGTITATTVVGEYKKFGDLLLPSRVTQTAAGIETLMTIDEVEFDTVDPSVFEPPAEVKALLEKPAEKADAPAAAPGKQSDP
jgi:hypothetical protein